MQAKIMLVNQHRTCERAGICKEVEKFQLFGAIDTMRMNLQRLYTIATVLRVFYLKRDCLNFLILVFYQTSIVYTPFGLNQHTSMRVAGTRLLACKHCVYGVVNSASQ